MNKHTRTSLRAYIDDSIARHPLAVRVVDVLERLPSDVLDDLFEDARFRLCLDDYCPSKGRTVWIASPDGSSSSRCVVLKPMLASCREAFAHYVIAHELAHAYLRNGGWGAIEDPEDAADALAETWGFKKSEE